MLIPWEFEHVLHVCRHMATEQVKEAHALSWWDEYDPVLLAIETWNTAAFGHTLVHEGLPHTVCGYSFIRPGVARSFCFGKDGFFPIAMTRHAKKVMGALLGQAHRLETLSIASHKAAHRWFRLIGLEQESVLKSYGRGGEDFLMFVRRAG